MRDTFVISGLRRKRARIAGEIDAALRRIKPLRDQLATVDATLALMQPGADPDLIQSIRPKLVCQNFGHGERVRLILSALREAKGPVTCPAIAATVMRAKRMETGDAKFRRAITEQVRFALRYLARRGMVRKVVREPDVWWELVDDGGAWRQRGLL